MTTILAPVLALIAWSLLVLYWMFVVRVGAMRRLKIRPENGANARKLGDLLPPNVQSVADNYNHLMEQPTLFYALCLALFVGDLADPIQVGLAWAYVAGRVIHTLIQGTSNVVMQRFMVFLFTSFVLTGMVGKAIFDLFTAA
jgi:hypothetical protein